MSSYVIQPQDLADQSGSVILDCRFSLADESEGRNLYNQGHIPGAHYVDLAQDLSAPVAEHGGRHPLPAADTFADTLASLGIGPDTQVIAYDDSRFAFASRLWWMMRSIGYTPPRFVDGGYQAWLALGEEPSTIAERRSSTGEVASVSYAQVCDIDGVREALGRSARLIDSREEARYQGLQEPIDPVAGHIPGAINFPWQQVSGDNGKLFDPKAQQERLQDVLDAPEIVVYCGSGVTACVNLLALAMAGREDAVLYSGSWSDWCSYM